eukprot:6572788-Alexandrium_andersonii.AAC.1
MDSEREHRLHSEPYGLGLQGWADAEHNWIDEEKEVRNHALEQPEMWQTMPLGSGDDSEASERF